MIKRGWITLNKKDCLSTGAKATMYRAAEKNCPTKMLKTSWHQGWPLNAFRLRHSNQKIDYKNQRNAAGCSIVALAHLFYYYKDFPQTKVVFDNLSRLQTSYPMRVYSDRVEVEYEKGKSLTDIKEYTQYIKKHFVYGKFTSRWAGSSGIPREKQGLLDKNKGLSTVLTKMRGSAKPKDWKTAAELLYESIVLNNVPALIWLQQDAHWGIRVNGHFAVVDGCKVDTEVLLKTKSFKDACKFHYHMVNANYKAATDATGEQYEYYGSDGEQILSMTLPEIGEEKDFDRVRKIFFYSSYYKANEAEPSINGGATKWNFKLEAGRNSKHIYYKITNTGKSKIETVGQLSALATCLIMTSDGKEHKSEFYTYLCLEEGKSVSNFLSFSYAISKIASINVKVKIQDAYGNVMEKATNVSLKNVKATEIKSMFRDLQFAKV